MSPPDAAAITFLQIARPALRKAAGLPEEVDNRIPAVSGFDDARKLGRGEHLPVTRDRRDPSAGRSFADRTETHRLVLAR